MIIIGIFEYLFKITFHFVKVIHYLLVSRKKLFIFLSEKKEKYFGFSKEAENGWIITTRLSLPSSTSIATADEMGFFPEVNSETISLKDINQLRLSQSPKKVSSLSHFSRKSLQYR